MCAISSLIRERPNWWEEVKDKAVIERWRGEILQQQEASGESPSRRLTTAMVKPHNLRIAPPVPYFDP